MRENEGQIYGSQESSTGLVKTSAYIDEVTRHLDDKPLRQQAADLVRTSLAKQPQNQDFCLTSNEIGADLLNGGHLELAVQCFEWAFEQSEAFLNFGQPNLNTYASNFIKALERLTQLSENSEQRMNFLRDKKKAIDEVKAYLTLLKDYQIFQRAYNQLQAKGGIVWDGDQNQQEIMAIQTPEQTAITLSNLL